MPYAFSHVMKPFKLAQKVKVTASIDSKSCTTKFYSNERTIVTSKLSCECGFFKAMQLPCRHIFSLRQHTHLNLFDDQLCALQWTRDYYKKSQRVFSSSSVRISEIIVNTIKEPSLRILSQ